MKTLRKIYIHNRRIYRRRTALHHRLIKAFDRGGRGFLTYFKIKKMVTYKTEISKQASIRFERLEEEQEYFNIIAKTAHNEAIKREAAKKAVSINNLKNKLRKYI